MSLSNLAEVLPMQQFHLAFEIMDLTLLYLGEAWITKCCTCYIIKTGFGTAPIVMKSAIFD